MKITNEFTVQIPIDQAWKVLTDLEGIAPCMPGAQLTGVEGEVYKGKVKVKVGPVISEFSGTAQFTAKDDTTYQAVIDAKGRDARSAGNASATVSATLTADTPTSTKVSVDTDLKISGKLAQFGSGMIKEVSSKLLAQFVANLEKKLATDASHPVADPTLPAAASSASPASASAEAAAAPASAAGPAGTASASAVATAPAAAVALGEVAPAAPEADDTATPAVVPDPSAGDVPPAAGRLETAEGTPEPIAPLRTPEADLSTTPTESASEAVSAASVAPSITPAESASEAVSAASVAHSATPAAPASAAAVAASTAPAEPASPAAVAPPTERVLQTEEAEAIDLLAVAGGSIYKRVIPVAIGAAAVAAVIIWFVARG